MGEILKASVIIPTRDRADCLSNCLEALTRQTLPPKDFEVLVMDNASRDHTAEIARRYSKLLQLSYLRTASPGLHIGRNEGMQKARSDILVFTDDDADADPWWVESVVRAFEDSAVALVGGNNRPRFEAAPPTWLRYWWNQTVYRGHAIAALSILDFGDGHFDVDPAYIWGCNFSIRRSVLEAAGGFHPDGFPKELIRLRGDGETHVSEVVRQSGLRAVFDSQASVWHKVAADRMTKAYLEQRAHAQGISDSFSDIRRQGGLGRPTATILRRKLSFLALFVRRYPSVLKNSEAMQLSSIQSSMRKAYWRGFDFHQQQVSKDPELLDWVLKDKYF